MIGKVLSGQSFGGCVRYVMGKPGAEVIAAVGVRMESAKLATTDFNAQRKLRPGLGEAVGHISLNWSLMDLEKLDSEKMEEMAMEYLTGMKITATQLLLVRHYDAAHPHLHIIYNRVDNNGRTISDNFLKRRNIEVSQRMTKKFGFYMGQDKNLVRRERLKGSDKVRYLIYDKLKTAIPKSRSFGELERRLAKDGISVAYKFKSGTAVVQGISFGHGGQVFKGSAIDRSMGLSGIKLQLGSNLAAPQVRQWQNARNVETAKISHSSDHGSDILDMLLRKEHAQQESLGLIGRRKRKNRDELGFGL